MHASGEKYLAETIIGGWRRLASASTADPIEV
jgi:hypothetical protein